MGVVQPDSYFHLTWRVHSHPEASLEDVQTNAYRHGRFAHKLSLPWQNTTLKSRSLVHLPRRATPQCSVWPSQSAALLQGLCSSPLVHEPVEPARVGGQSKRHMCSKCETGRA
eukprot:1148314-Pelagomonas_calceolata.AAC.7